MLAAWSQGDVYSEESSSLLLSGASVPAFNCHHASLPRAGSYWRCLGARLPQGEILSSAQPGSLLVCHDPGTSQQPGAPQDTVTNRGLSPQGRRQLQPPGKGTRGHPSFVTGKDERAGRSPAYPGPRDSAICPAIPAGPGMPFKGEKRQVGGRGCAERAQGRGGDVLSPRRWHVPPDETQGPPAPARRSLCHPPRGPGFCGACPGMWAL